MGTVLSSVKYTPDGVPYHELKDFKDLQRLDSGGYGTVFKGYVATRLTLKKRTVAVKVFNQLDVYVEREIQILKTHSHPHIVELFGVIWDGATKDGTTKMPLCSGYVMEYLELGSLHNEIHDVSKHYDMKLIVLWIEQIGSGLQYLHENGILHRDVKPSNILLATRTHLKLADFVLARNISHRNTYTSGRIGSYPYAFAATSRIGTDPYMAPEIVGTEKNNGPSADVYSFGVTIWEIICRKYPSENQKFENGCIELPIDLDKMSEDSWNFVKRCWQREISVRPSVEEISAFAATFDQTVGENLNMGNFKSSMKYTPDGVPYYALKDIEILKSLDTGAFGTAFKGYATVENSSVKTKQNVAVILFSKQYENRIEAQILRKLTHPNIVELFGVIWDGEVSRDRDLGETPLYTGYVMEYMELGSLHNEIHDSAKHYDLKLIVSWIQQIGSGLQYLHENGIIHRDVKPKNILLVTRIHLKLAGFGLARNISYQQSCTTDPIGTNIYMAPEVITSTDYGPPADVFSFGVTIWEIIHRKRPDLNMGADSSGNVYVDLPMDSALLDKYKPKLRKRSPQEGSQSSKSGLEKVTSTSCNINKATATFLQSMLSPTPSERPSIKEIIEFFSETVLPNYLNTILVVGRPLKTAVLNQDEWLRLQIEVPQDIHLEGGAVCLNNEMYLVGEYFHHRGLYKLDKNNYNWIRLADMQVGRQWITNSCLEWNGSIWVFGGENEETGEYLNSVERYDPSGNEWITMPDMTYPRRAAAATVCNGKIYVCGGRTGQADRPKSVECFDLESGVWNELVALPIPLYGHSLVSYGHKLIVMGGYDGRAYSSTVLELDPLEENGQWRELAPMSHGCAYFAGLVLGEDIYVIGGRDETGYTSRVQIFNGNEWRDGPTLPSECSRPSAVVIPQPLAD